MKTELIILSVALLWGCGRHSDKNKTVLVKPENIGTSDKKEVNSNLVGTIIENTSNKNDRTTANIEKIKRLVNEYETNYLCGTLKPYTKETINIARALKTNLTISTEEKIAILINRRPSSMAQKGAELALYLSELERTDLSELEKVKLLNNISCIYEQFHEYDLAIKNMEEALEICLKSNDNSDVSRSYESLAQLHRNGKKDDSAALEYYEYAVEAGGYDDYDKIRVQEIILNILAQNDRREDVKKYYDNYKKDNQNSFEDIKYYLENPEVKIKYKTPALRISGDPREIPGLNEIIHSRDSNQIDTFMRKIIEASLNLERGK